jgi:hypothetical protein
VRQFRQQFSQHGDVVTAAKGRDAEQALYFGALQGVGQFPRPVGGVDVDQDGADARRGQLQQQPLYIVG